VVLCIVNAATVTAAATTTTTAITTATTAAAAAAAAAATTTTLSAATVDVMVPFLRSGRGAPPGVAEASGAIGRGDLLLSANGLPVFNVGLSFPQIIDAVVGLPPGEVLLEFERCDPRAVAELKELRQRERECFTYDPVRRLTSLHGGSSTSTIY
jgi:hypothetical protein